MLPERQAAVEAILNAGHIPAGMELFAAGDKSQLDVIRRWIDESDVFMLILGSRYGSIDTPSGKSYIHLEYEYALEKSKPHFVAVISDKASEKKVKKLGTGGVDDPKLLKQFRDGITLGKLCKFFDEPKDIKLIVFESLALHAANPNLSGWVRGSDVINPKETAEALARLSAENADLRKRLEEANASITREMIAGIPIEEAARRLYNERIDLSNIIDETSNPLIPNTFKVEMAKAISTIAGSDPVNSITCLSVLLNMVEIFAKGVGPDKHNRYSTRAILYYYFSAKLALYNIVSINDGICHLTADGARFVNLARPIFDRLEEEG